MVQPGNRDTGPVQVVATWFREQVPVDVRTGEQSASSKAEATVSTETAELEGTRRRYRRKSQRRRRHRLQRSGSNRHLRRSSHTPSSSSPTASGTGIRGAVHAATQSTVVIHVSIMGQRQRQCQRGARTHRDACPTTSQRVWRQFQGNCLRISDQKELNISVRADF